MSNNVVEVLIPCNVLGQKIDKSFFIGRPVKENGPIDHQVKYFGEKGITVTETALDGIRKIQELASKNGIPLMNMMDYVSKKTSIKNSAVTKKGGFGDPAKSISTEWFKFAQEMIGAEGGSLPTRSDVVPNDGAAAINQIEENRSNQAMQSVNQSSNQKLTNVATGYSPENAIVQNDKRQMTVDQISQQNTSTQTSSNTIATVSQKVNTSPAEVSKESLSKSSNLYAASLNDSQVSRSTIAQNAQPAIMQKNGGIYGADMDLL